MATPSGHNLYWVYIYYADGAYNFGTAKTVSEAKQIANDFAGGGLPYSNIYIFYGNQDGAFTDHDAYSSRTPSSDARRTATKRKRAYANRSKSSGRAKKRRTLTKLRASKKRRGFGVMKTGHASSYDRHLLSAAVKRHLKADKHVNEHLFVGSGTWCDRCGQHIDSLTHDY